MYPKMTKFINPVLASMFALVTILHVTNGDNRTCAGCSQCPSGRFISKPCSAKNDTVCSDCPANFICKNGLKNSCPGPTISAPVATTTCTCPPGTFGSVVYGTAEFACVACPIGMFCPLTTTPESTCTC